MKPETPAERQLRETRATLHGRRSAALARVKRYVVMRQKKPLRQIDDTIHGVHSGTEWEADLRLSDLIEVLALAEGSP